MSLSSLGGHRHKAFPLANHILHACTKEEAEESSKQIGQCNVYDPSLQPTADTVN